MSTPIDFTPVSGIDLPRFAGIPTFMRLPHVSLDSEHIGSVDIGLIGAPWDSGTTNRSGARHGPRQLRDLSTMIHFDSHTDLFDSYFDGNRYTHGTPFRRAVEEGLLDPKRVVQIGIRGTAYNREDRDFADAVGIRIIPIEEFFARDVEEVMSEARQIVGDTATYISYDIDFVDPTFAPGTGTPEVGGPNSFQALQVVRELAGVKIVGADLVEVSPPFDSNGATAWLGASLMFELLCVMV